MDSPTRLTILISGSGTNLQAVIDAINAKTLPATVVRVISNRKEAYGLERAKKAGIPTTYHNLLSYKKKHPNTEEGVKKAREEYDIDLARLVLDDKPDLVVCLGFMYVLSKKFLDPMTNAGLETINLHPALPGAFNGTHAIERAHEAWLEGKIDKTGVMVHKVIAEVDMGEPILVREIPFIKGVDEDLEALKERIHKIEWEVVIEGINIMIKRMQEKS
ncbi:Bifunctional purine biosynthetic protein ADE5,7 [Microsporum ferrugineum]